MTLPVVFHSVWEEKLHIKERANYLRQAERLTDTTNTVLPIRINEKKNGGLVATVFIQNKELVEWSLEQIVIALHDEAGNLCAQQSFTLDLHIPGQSMMLWSFVFDRENRTTKNAPSNKWTAHVAQ